MRIGTGIDLVDVAEFAARTTAGGPEFLLHIFHESELVYANTVERRAGMFAAKEAVAKALGLPVGSWHDIVISHEASGRPRVAYAHSNGNDTIDISISHHGRYAVANAVVLYA